MASIPSKYAYLNTVGQLPRMITEALKLYGTKETKGNGNNPVIMGWARELGIRDYNMDSIPWCGLFINYVAVKAGKEPVASPLWARNWSKFGVKSPQAGLGDVLVFSRDGGGHVGLYVGESATTYHVLGGNQGDAVSFTEIAKTRCIAVRRPPYNAPPASVRPFRLNASGVVSTNES